MVKSTRLSPCARVWPARLGILERRWVEGRGEGMGGAGEEMGGGQRGRDGRSWRGEGKGYGMS